MYELKATAAECERALRFAQSAVPVSFFYGGVPFPQGFDGADGSYTAKDTGLTCSFPFTVYEESAAVEWLPVFSAGKTVTGQVRQVCALDCFFETDGPAELYYALGATSRIDAFALQHTPLQQRLVLQSMHSCQYLPFFNLVTGSGGVLIGLGFTGAWEAAFTPQEGGIRVTVKMPQTDFYLYPGEQVRNIRVLLQFWQGERRRSFNLLRSHLLRHVIPADENGEAYPPVCCSSWGGMKTENHLKYIRYLKENGMKFDCYWMDAGWHGPDHETDEFQNMDLEDWAYHIGDWKVNRAVHPQGLRPVVDAAHGAGMKFLLWFASYNCVNDQGWYAQHPEWAISYGPPRGVGKNPRPVGVGSIRSDVPEAWNTLTGQIMAVLEENGVDYYREDAHPAVPENEPGRTGVAEMKTVQRLYDFWDALLARFPGMLIDNCGGGGTRIDLETLKRSYVLWRSDYNCHPGADPIGSQVGNHGLGHFVPLVGGAAPVSPGSSYHTHSSLYGGMGFGLMHVCGFTEDAAEHTWIRKDYPVAWHRRMLEQYQRVKRYFAGSFYPLTDCDTSTESAVSYQFDRPDLGEGAVLAFFRQDCPPQPLTVKPVLEDGAYRFEDLESGESFILQTQQVRQLTLHAAHRPGSVLLVYQKLAE